MPDSWLLLFVRNPVLGRVKTRLAQGLGEERALAIYYRLLRVLQAESERVSVPKVVYYDQFIDREDLWAEAGYEQFVQSPGDLGVRMNAAFLERARLGGGPCVLVGSDVPDLTAEIIEQAFALLETTEVVLGPAVDGGYYLIGLQQPQPSLFEGIEWSTERVLDQTQEKVEKAGLSLALLPVLRDVDQPSDLPPDW